MTGSTLDAAGAGGIVAAGAFVSSFLSPLNNEANDPPVESLAVLGAAPNPANPVAEGDLAANPPNPPEILPTGAGALPNADAEGVDGLPKAEEPKPVDPNPDDSGVVEAGLENAFGVPLGLAGVEVGVVDCC